MTGKNKFIERKLQGFEVYQRQTDGYINATQICKAHTKITGERRDPNDILKTAAMQRAISKLSTVTNIFVTDLVQTQTGGKYQGTWIHPRLGVRFTMLLNDDFSLLVEDWVHSWFELGYNPAQLQVDSDRVAIRDELKDVRRIALTKQIQNFLEMIGEYQPGSKETGIFFGRVHNEVNLVLTGEKAKDMRQRLEKYLGKKVSEQELLRDYFNIVDLSNYVAICQAAANNIENGLHPINAVQLAAKQVLPSNYAPKPIDFIEEVSSSRKRIEQAKSENSYIEGT